MRIRGRACNNAPPPIRGYRVLVDPRNQALDLGQLEQTFLSAGEVKVEEVRAHFLPYVHDALRFFASKRSARNPGS